MSLNERLSLAESIQTRDSWMDTLQSRSKTHLGLCPNTLCILFSDTKGIQWVDTYATDVCVCEHKEGPNLKFNLQYASSD